MHVVIRLGHEGQGAAQQSFFAKKSGQFLLSKERPDGAGWESSEVYLTSARLSSEERLLAAGRRSGARPAALAREDTPHLAYSNGQQNDEHANRHGECDTA